MYSGEGACMLVEENVSGGEKLGLHGKKKMRSGALEKKISVRLRVLRMYVCMVL